MAARGIYWAHQCDILHRDIAARNLLIDRKKWEVVVCDFGLSVSDLMDTESREQHLTFPIPWTAPEILTDKQFSFKSDVYSFGMLI
eukprot:UN28302